MTIKDSLAAQLEREVHRSRKAIEQMPAGKSDWKPHDKSMQFGYLADMIATIPSWIVFQLTQDSLDVAPADGSKFPRTPKITRADHPAPLRALCGGSGDRAHGDRAREHGRRPISARHAVEIDRDDFERGPFLVDRDQTGIDLGAHLRLNADRAAERAVLIVAKNA